MNSARYLVCVFLAGCSVNAEPYDPPPLAELSTPRLSCYTAEPSSEYPGCKAAACECTDDADFCDDADNDGAMCCIDTDEFVAVGTCREGACDWDTCYAARQAPVGVCDARDKFLGSDGCYQPSAECCPGAVDAFYGCDGAEVLYLCSVLPSELGGARTDYRACHVPSMGTVDCAWGASTPLCCEP